MPKGGAESSIWREPPKSTQFREQIALPCERYFCGSTRSFVTQNQTILLLLSIAVMLRYFFYYCVICHVCVFFFDGYKISNLNLFLISDFLFNIFIFDLLYIINIVQKNLAKSWVMLKYYIFIIKNWIKRKNTKNYRK